MYRDKLETSSILIQIPHFFIFSHLKISSNHSRKLAKQIIEKPVIFGWRARSFQHDLTEVPPFDAKFKDKSDGGFYITLKPFLRGHFGKTMKILGGHFFVTLPLPIFLSRKKEQTTNSLLAVIVCEINYILITLQ